jgi:hypothetical protein
VPDENPNIIEINDHWKKKLQSSAFFSSKIPYHKIVRITWQNSDVAEEGIEATEERVQAQEVDSARILQRNLGRDKKSKGFAFRFCKSPKFRSEKMIAKERAITFMNKCV